jgi:hypothetical protein
MWSCALCRTRLEEAPNLITCNRDEPAVDFLKEPEAPEVIALRSARWKFVRRSRSEMTGEIFAAITIRR